MRKAGGFGYPPAFLDSSTVFCWDDMNEFGEPRLRGVPRTGLGGLRKKRLPPERILRLYTSNAEIRHKPIHHEKGRHFHRNRVIARRWLGVPPLCRLLWREGWRVEGWRPLPKSCPGSGLCLAEILKLCASRYVGGIFT